MKSSFTLPLLFLCAGCVTTVGPSAVFNAKGPIDSGATKGLAKKFIDAHDDAFKIEHSYDPAYATRMVESGFSLIYVNCDDFFQSAGETQKWILFSRDAVGMLGTLASGIMALHSDRKNASGNVALATGAAFAGLDIYTKNFLFSAENVSSVQDLTKRALSVHQQAVLNAGVASYDDASAALVDNQKICSPMHIAALARDAIKSGTVVAEQSSDGLSRVTEAQDQKVLERLGALLNPPGAISPRQAGAFWWLYKEASSLGTRTTQIIPALSGLPDASMPLDAGGQPKPGFNSSVIIAELDKFSDKTKASFKSVAAAKNKELDALAAAPIGNGIAAVAAPVGGAATPQPVEFTLPVSATGRRFTTKVK